MTFFTFSALCLVLAGALAESEQTFVVKLAEGVVPEDFAAAHNLRFVGGVGYLEGYFEFGYTELSVRDEFATRDEAELREMGVEWLAFQENRVRETRGFSAPTDPSYSKQWHLARINAPGAWERGHLGAGVTIAVVDDGLQTTNPDIADNYCAEGSYNFNDNKDDPSPTYQQYHGGDGGGAR